MKIFRTALTSIAKVGLGVLVLAMATGGLCLLYWLFSHLAVAMNILMGLVLVIMMYILGDMTCKIFIDPLCKRRKKHEEDSTEA